MGRQRSPARLWRAALLIAPLVWAAACSSDDADTQSSVPPDDTVTVGSFDFAESLVLAHLYGAALTAHGFTVEVQRSLGPRELVMPALASGLVEVIPEYAGTALAFVSLGAVRASPEPAVTHASLVEALASDGRVIALAPAPAENANAVVVTAETAERHSLRTISDLARVADQLTFGGPAECPSRPFCLLGLQSVYDLRFKEFVPLDASGPATHDALSKGQVDVVLLFTTDPRIGDDGFVELVDDRRLQPAENVTPLVNATLTARFGAQLTDVLDEVSAHLTTDDLRALNESVAIGVDPADAATAWLTTEGLV